MSWVIRVLEYDRQPRESRVLVEPESGTASAILYRLPEPLEPGARLRRTALRALDEPVPVGAVRLGALKVFSPAMDRGKSGLQLTFVSDSMDISRGVRPDSEGSTPPADELDLQLKLGTSLATQLVVRAQVERDVVLRPSFPQGRSDGSGGPVAGWAARFKHAARGLLGRAARGVLQSVSPALMLNATLTLLVLGLLWSQLRALGGQSEVKEEVSGEAEDVATEAAVPLETSLP